MDLNQLMKQAQSMQKQMMDAQEELANKEFEGKSGGSMVCVKVTGKGKLKSVKIDKSILSPDDHEMVEDLVLAAVNDAMEKLEESKDSMGNMFGNLPGGMKLPF